MANRTFLLCDDHISDSATPTPPPAPDADYDPEKATVAEGARGVPLLWLPLFRPANLRHWPADKGGGEVEMAIADKQTALAQFDAALPVLNDLFIARGPLDEYAHLLKQALIARTGRMVAWEFTERAWLERPGSYRTKIQFLLSFADDPEVPPPAPKQGFFGKLFARAQTDPRVVALKWFTEVSGIDPKRPFRPLKPPHHRTDNDWHVIDHLLGGSWMEPVPWEA